MKTYEIHIKNIQYYNFQIEATDEAEAKEALASGLMDGSITIPAPYKESGLEVDGIEEIIN